MTSLEQIIQADRRLDPWVRRALRNWDITARAIRFVCRKYAVTVDEIEEPRVKRAPVRHARQLAVWLVRRYTSYEVTTIALIFDRTPDCIQAWLDDLEDEVQSSCRAGRDAVALDCAFWAFESSPTDPADKPY